MIPLKQCARCHELRALSLFGFHKLTSDRLQSYCNPCQAELARIRRAADPEHARKVGSAWKSANRDRINAQRRERRNANPEKTKIFRAVYRKKYLARELETGRAYKATHRAELHAKAFAKYWSDPEKSRADQLAYRREHPGKDRAWRMNRITRERQAMPAWADKKAIEAIYRRAVLLTKSTGVPYEVDHIIPLKGRNVCGLHCEANLRVITKQENRRKSNLFDQSLLAAMAA